MAIRLPDILEISDAAETNTPCEFCRLPEARPDDLDAWADHLGNVHGYGVVTVDARRPRDVRRPCVVRLRLVGWSSKAKFQPNDRIAVNDRAPTNGGRRGTVVGWHTSRYAVRFDEQPVLGWFDPDWLDGRVKIDLGH